VFTLQGHGRKCLEQLAETNPVIRLARIVIDRANLAKLSDELRVCGIYRHALFPSVTRCARSYRTYSTPENRLDSAHVVSCATLIRALAILRYVVLSACGLFAVAVVIGVGGVHLPAPSPREVSQRQPFASFVGHEYRIASDLIATGWNDFPNKSKILLIALRPPPGTANRFVSFRRGLKAGQRLRLVSAWRQFTIGGFNYYYLVALPGAGLPEGIPIVVDVSGNGVPDPALYAPIGVTAVLSDQSH
jgi:hypothetical protein